MIKQLLAIVFFASAAFFCGAQTPLYRIMQHAGNADRYYSICFDPNKMLWAGGRPNGLRLNRTDANLEIKSILGLNAEPGIEYYISEIGWDTGNRLVGCGNYQDGNFGKGFIVRFDPLAFPNELLFLKKIEGDSVRLSGLVQSPADSALWVYGTSRVGGVQRGELFKFDQSTGALRPGFPKRYSVGQGLSLDAAILHAGRLYTAGTCSPGGNSTAFGLACLDATSGEPLWFSSNPAPAGQTMHLEARDLIFTNDDGDALVVVGSGDDQHSPAQGSHIFLQKSRLDGSLLWIKKIDLPDWTDEFAEEVVAVSDGYLIYGHSRNPAEAGVFLLKTDKNGQTKWARKISRGTATTLPDWPAQSQMLVGNEAVYLTCNAAVTTSFGPRVTLLVKLPLDGAFANCPNVQPILAINLPFNNLSSIGLGLSATASPLQVTTITAPVQTDSPQALGSGAYCTQTGYICNDRPDLTARVDSLICLPAGAYAASISVCNLGKAAPDTGFYLTFYDKNPLVGSAAALQSVFLGEKPQPGSCVKATVQLDAALLKHPKIFTLVGTGANVPTPISLSGFPFAGGFAECEYANNVDSFVVNKPDCNGGNDCADAETFLKKLGSRLDVDLVFSMCKTADGNLYLAGRKNPIDHFITKMTPGGDVIWMRKIPAGTNGSNSRIAEIIEDSDGKIVFCATQGITPNARTVFAMRYDPVGDTLIWFKYFGATRPAAVGIVEKGPGGNFVATTYSQVISTGRIYAQIFELGRNTGETVPGAITSRYEGSSLVRFERMVARQNSLYATGARQQNNGEPTRSIFAKLSASTGSVEWVQATTPDSTSSAQPDVLHTDLEFDGDFALMVGSGLRDAASPSQGTFAYLEKHAPDGSLLWLKRYEASIYPEDVLVLPNAYIIVGKMADNRWALLKTDKDGNPLIFKTLNTSSAPLSNTLLANRQGLILDAGSHLFMADYGPMMDDASAVWLLKTSHDLELDEVCGLLQPASVQATTMPAKSALVPLTRAPFIFSTADAGVIYEKDSLQICGLCPACPCCAPDLTARVDSIGCLSFDAIVANVSVCNLGETSPDTGFYLTFYDKNPLIGSAAVLQSVFLAEKPQPGSCVQATVPLDAALLKHPKIFTLVGVGANVPTPVSLSGFPFAGGFGECEYANNLDSFQIVLLPDCTPDPDSCAPNTFLKISGKTGGFENASALRAAPDGNLYLAGRKGAGGVIYKTTPDGKLLWAHSFLVSGPQLGISISEIIVDSEGLIVGAGRIVGNQFFSDKTLAFRFNPTAFQMLWVRQFDSNSATEGGILEKTPGGNYLLYHNPDPMPTGGAQKAEILELDRTTGQIVPAFANRYQHFQNQTLQSMVAYGGALYATGFADTVISGLGARRRVLITKLDASTGQVIWSRIGPKDWSKVAYYLGGDLIVDGNNLLTLYHGNETGNSISGNGKIAPMFLQKTTLDGEVLWVKKYMVTAFPRELVAVPDGYVLFGGYAKRYLLKTDKEGNLLVSKELKSTQYFIVHDNDAENQIERIGSSLFIASNTGIGSQLGQYTTLLKTDLNLDMEFSCGLVSNPVSDSTVVNPANIAVQQSATASPALQQGLAMTLAPDEMTIKENCPVCSDPVCSDRPDLTAHVDSITCSFFDGAIAHVSVCNLGKVSPAAGFNLTFYDKNPLASGAAALQSVFVEEQPDTAACVQTVVPLSATLLQHAKIYTLVGVKGNVPSPISLGGFPFPGGFAECDYANNLDSFDIVLPPIQKLDLGPDRSICTGQTVTLDAGSGYVLYNWSAGPNTQTYTTDATGSFAVEVIDACGRKQRDTVQVTVLPSPTRVVHIALLPGDSVVIGGKTYKGTTTLVDTVPSLTGGCDTVLTYQVRLDSLHCPKAASFLKTYKGGLGRVVRPAADGGYYIGGEANEQAAISDKEIVKMDAAGKVLWTRTFDFLPNFAFDALLEDSEGRLVVLATSLAAPSSIAVFRYDPAADQVLWIRRMTPPQTDVFAFDLFEKSPGGDFLIAYRLRKNNTELSTEICSLDRATGNLVGGEVWHYEPHAWVNAVALHQNALYANGLLRDPADPGVTYRYGLMKIDLNTGDPLWSRLTTAVQPGLDLGSGDVLVDGAGDVVSTVSEPGKAIGLQKTAPNGDLVWLKRLQFNEPLASNFIPKSIVLLNDGYLISADPFFNGASTNALFFVKTNFNGDVMWAKKLSKAGAGYTSGSPNLLAVRAGKGCFIANVIHQGFLFADMALGQMDADGNLGEGCTLLENASVTVSNQTATQDPALVTFSILSRTFTSLQPTASKAAQLLPTTLCTKCLPPCEDVAVTQTIQFYPGDTITIDGKAYTQSDTVVQTFTTPAGCDSVVTNILQRILTELSISCPADLTVTLPPNEIKTVVDYTLPTATTTCPDPTISLRLLQGLPVGGSFSQGKTLVCYEAANECGIRDTCCFSITALPPDPACDVKTPSGCVRYELLGIRLDAQGQRRYRVRITNLCASPLAFAYIQLPNGVLAVAPVQGATYTAPGGNAYTVRNPNASPFYSIRYQAVVGNLNNGKSNIFEYTLPQQAQPAYIRASARLADGSYSETHLNTFYCPEVIENLELRMENFSRSSSSAPISILNSQLLVRPNPTSGVLHWRFDFKSNLQSETPVHLRVLNAQGQLVLERDCVIEAEEMRLDLPAGLASGLYYLVAQPEGGERAAARFVLER